MGSLQWSPTPSSFVPRGSAALRLSANCLNVDELVRLINCGAEPLQKCAA